MASRPTNDANDAIDRPLWKVNGPASTVPIGPRMTNANTPVIMTGDKTMDLPRGVRTPSRKCARATADAPDDKPGCVRLQAAPVRITRRVPFEPGDPRTLANAIMPMA